MFTSMSSSGMYKDELMGIEVTLMDSAEFPFPVSRHTIFNITIRCKDREQLLELSHYRFYLMSGSNIHNSIDINQDAELHKYIYGSGNFSLFFGNTVAGWCESQYITILFPRMDEIHYKPSSIIFYYEPYERLIQIPLTY